MGVILGFVSALSFGSADFIARGVSVKLTPYRALFYVHLLSGVLLVIASSIDGLPASATLDAVGLGVVLGAVNTLGTLMLYRALSIGKIAIVSPVTSTFGGVALVLSLLAGDAISRGGIFSLLLMLGGIVIVSSVREDPQKAVDRSVMMGLPEALISALALGINFWGLQFVVASLGPYIPTLIGRIMTVIVLPVLARPLHQSVALPARGYGLNLAVVGFLTTLGEIAYNVGIQGTTPGIVAVLSSLFSPVTVLLALIFLREQLARYQWVGVGVIFIATLLLGLFQSFNPV